MAQIKAPVVQQVAEGVWQAAQVQLRQVQRILRQGRAARGRLQGDAGPGGQAVREGLVLCLQLLHLGCQRVVVAGRAH